MKTSDIFQLVRLGNNSELIRLLDLIDINELNDLNQNLLHEAIAFANEDIVKKLIDKKINVNQKDKKGQSPLHYAAAHSQVEIAAAILNHGGDLKVVDNFGNQPLWTAVFNSDGKYELVKLFINYDADANHVNEAERSPLDFAIELEDQTLIDLLTKKEKIGDTDNLIT